MTAHTIIFAPIEQATRSEQVVGRLENAIISGLLKSNEQLPNEADLALWEYHLLRFVKH